MVSEAPEWLEGNKGNLRKQGTMKDKARKICAQTSLHSLGFPGSLTGKESACNAGDLGSIPWLGGIDPWRRERLPTLVFWPGEFHGLYNPWGCKESDRTERLPLSLWMTCMHVGEIL